MTPSRFESPEYFLKSELLFDAIWRSSTDGIRLVDQEHRIVMVNPAYCKLVHMSEENLTGLPFYEVYAQDHHELVRSEMVQILETVTAPEIIEREYRLWDTSIRCFELCNTIVESAEGTRFVLSLVRDRTEHKLLDRAMEERGRHFRLLYENAPLSYQSLDKEGNILDVNPTWLSTFGYEWEEIRGRKFTDFMTPASAVRAEMEFAEFIKTGEIHNIDYEMIRKDSTHIFVSYEGKIAFDESGAFKQTHCIITNITERKRTEEELQNLYRQTRKYAQQKDELLNEINHRVKNNLMTILGLILAEKRRTSSAVMHDGDARWDEFELRINGLLNVHQMLSDSQWAPLNISDLSGSIVHGVLSIYEPEIEVLLDIEPSDITVSPRQANNLALVLNELATNSMRHAFIGIASPEIRIKYWTEGDEIYIEFSDNGTGYPDDIMEGRNENVGLHLVRQLIEETLGGKVRRLNRNGAVTLMAIKAEEPAQT